MLLTGDTVQALIGPFLLRLEGFTNAGVVPESIAPLMAKETPKFTKWAEATCAVSALSSTGH